MSKTQLNAEKINSPIQLMAAWFVMLIILSGVLLAAAAKISQPNWAAGYLVISTTVLILIVVISVLLMLTKFRPNLQEGETYAKWLKDQNSYSSGVIPKSDEQPGDNHKKIKEKLEHLKTDLSQVDVVERLENNFLYSVMMSDLHGSEEVIKSISELNIDASVYEYSQSANFSEHQSIWLGSQVPAELAIEIIKRACSIWPQLKYISLSSDSDGPEETNWRVYLGGATSSALDEGLIPWTNKELLNLEAKSITELHRKVRGKYS